MKIATLLRRQQSVVKANFLAIDFQRDILSQL
jgi:hypothetical protein